MPFDLLALVARGVCVPRAHKTIIIRKTVLDRLPHPEYCTDSRLKHIPSLPVKKAHLIVLELQPEG